jgi:hypothetical protein
MTQHAELLAISKAQQMLGCNDPSGGAIYSNVEPCVMCAFPMRETRIARVVFAIASPMMGGHSKWNATPRDDAISDARRLGLAERANDSGPGLPQPVDGGRQQLIGRITVALVTAERPVATFIHRTLASRAGQHGRPRRESCLFLDSVRHGVTSPELALC